jgi:hypothetical protein
MAGVPSNQLAMQKMMITLFDGITSRSPEGRWFKEVSEGQNGRFETTLVEVRTVVVLDPPEKLVGR